MLGYLVGRMLTTAERSNIKFHRGSGHTGVKITSLVIGRHTIWWCWFKVPQISDFYSKTGFDPYWVWKFRLTQHYFIMYMRKTNDVQNLAS